MNINRFQFEYPDRRQIQPAANSPPRSSQTQQHDEDDALVSSQLSSASQSKLPRATLEQKITVLDWHHLHSSSQQYTVSHFHRSNEFGITKSSFNRWLKDERKLRSAYKSMDIESRSNHKTVHNTKTPSADKCLEKWLEQKLFENYGVTEREMVRQWFRFQRLYMAGAESLTEELLEDVEDEDVTKSNGWLHHFKKRMKYRREQIVKFVDGEVSHFSETKNQELRRLSELLANYEIKDVFHLDEFGLTDRIVPIGTQYTRFTIGLCVNADGTELLDPLVISHNAEVEKCAYSRVGLTAEIFWSYMKQWDEKLSSRRVVVLLDRLHEHVVAQDLKNITVIWLEKADSPLRNIIRWFKLEFKSLLLKHMLVEWTNHRRIQSHPESEILVMINQVHDRLSQEKKVIRDSWNVSGILGEQQNAWVDFREQEEAFGRLLGVAQEKKLVDTFSLGYKESLFPPDEAVVNRHLSDQDIVALVKISEQQTIKVVKAADLAKKKNGQMMLAQRMDTTQWKKVDRLIHHEVTSFFEKDITRARFPRSSEAFIKFLNEYVSESIDS